MTQLQNTYDAREDFALPVTEPEPEGSRFGKAHHILLGFVILAIIGWLLSGFYKVNPDQVAIVERLGQYMTAGASGKVELVQEGLHYHLPWPIDQVHKVSIQQTRNMVVDEFNTPPQRYAEFKADLIRRNEASQDVLNAVFDPYLITADKNVVHMEIAIQYRVLDPVKWLLVAAHDTDSSKSTLTGNHELLFQEMAQHGLVHLIEGLPVDQVLLEGREKLPGRLSTALRNALSTPDAQNPEGSPIDMGIQVLKVDLVAVRAPALVQPSFDAVVNARIGETEAEVKAQSDADTMRTQALAEKQQLISTAQAYAKQVTNDAIGEAQRFASVYAQFKKAPDVTRWNVYADAVRTIASNANRLMFVQPGQQATITIDPPQFDARQAQPNR